MTEIENPDWSHAMQKTYLLCYHFDPQDSFFLNETTALFLLYCRTVHCCCALVFLDFFFCSLTILKGEHGNEPTLRFSFQEISDNRKQALSVIL